MVLYQTDDNLKTDESYSTGNLNGVYAEEKPQSKSKIFAAAEFMYSMYILFVLFSVGLLKIFHTNFTFVASKGLLRDLKVKKIKLTEKISDSEFGLITGPIFNVAMLTSGVFIGRATDLYSRKYLTFASLILWNIFIALTPSATSFWHLIYCQIGVSIGMGGINSLCFSLLTDYFTPKTRPIAVGLQSMSFIFGAGAAYGYGALLNDTSSNWRQLYYLSLVPGIVFSVLIFFTVVEPERGQADEFKTEKEALGLGETFIYLIKRPTFFLISIAGGMAMAGALVNQTWNPEFFNRIHNMTAQELAQYLSWISPVGGLAGSLISSIACGFLQKLTQRGYAIVILTSTIFLLPTPYFTLLIEHKVPSLLFLLPAAFFGFMILIPMNLVLIEIVPVSARGVAISWLMIFVTGLGSLGPYVAGLLMSLNFPFFDGNESKEAIRWAMVFAHSVTKAVLLVCSFAVIFTLPMDINALTNFYAPKSDEQEEFKIDE